MYLDVHIHMHIKIHDILRTPSDDDADGPPSPQGLTLKKVTPEQTRSQKPTTAPGSVADILRQKFARVRHYSDSESSSGDDSDSSDEDW